MRLPRGGFPRQRVWSFSLLVPRRGSSHPGLGNGLQWLLEVVSAPIPSPGISIPLYCPVSSLGSLMLMLQWSRST